MLARLFVFGHKNQYRHGENRTPFPPAQSGDPAQVCITAYTIKPIPSKELPGARHLVERITTLGAFEKVVHGVRFHLNK